MEDFLHARPNKLLIPEETLKTRDENQKRLTAAPRVVPESANENWSVVAVTLEKKVAMPVIFTYSDASRSFSSVRKDGSAIWKNE